MVLQHQGWRCLHDCVHDARIAEAYTYEMNDK
jgi:hypothetical protein